MSKKSAPVVLPDARINEIAALCRTLREDKRINNLSPEMIKDAAQQIERGIHREAIDQANSFNVMAYWENVAFVEIYSNIGYQLKINISPISSVNAKYGSQGSSLAEHIWQVMVIRKLFNYKISKSIEDILQNYLCWIDLTKLGHAAAIELNPHINKPFVDEIAIRDKQTIDVKFSAMYLCNNCGYRKTKSKEIQTRSGDEGGTQFVECIVCGNRWRIYG